MSFAYKVVWYSPPRMASLGFMWYFFKKSTSTFAVMSNRGFPNPSKSPSLPKKQSHVHILVSAEPLARLISASYYGIQTACTYGNSDMDASPAPSRRSLIVDRNGERLTSARSPPKSKSKEILVEDLKFQTGSTKEGRIAKRRSPHS